MAPLLNILNSNGFQTLVTFLVGLVALIVYLAQRSDYKTDAASTILLEIQGAERGLKKVKEDLSRGVLPADLLLVQSESWSKYKYLFARDFDRDEWDAVSEFYAKCQLIDEAMKTNNAGFWDDMKEIRANKQRFLADTVMSAMDPSTGQIAEALVKLKYSALDEAYMRNQTAYSPMKPVNDVKTYVNEMTYLPSQTSVGIKLKKMAKIR